MKTTTAEWLWEQLLRPIPNPRVLVITTMTGKGTYYESLAEVLPEWDVFTVNSRKTNLVIGSKPIPVDVEIPDPLYMRPIVVVAHYHCFTNRACISQPLKEKYVDENGEKVERQLFNENGTFKMSKPRCGRLLNMHWDHIVVDEAHRIKNHDAQWTRNIKKLKASSRHIMTGTGFVNNPAEIWSLLNFLYPKHYTSYWKFRERYCEEDDSSGYRKVVGIKPEREDEFRDLVRRIGVRRTMLECFPNIKKPIKTIIPVDLNPTQRKMYAEMVDQLRTMDLKGEPLHSPNVLSMLNRCRQIAVATPEVIEDYYDFKEERRIVKVKLTEPSSKLDAAMEIIEGLEWDSERKDQVVIFSNFKDPLLLMEARLKKKGIPYMRLLAEHNEKTRYEMWHDTWPKKEHQVFLTTLSLGSESINLTSAHRAIFLDQSWSPATNNQAVGRVYRPGQTGVAQLIYIRAEDTVDFRVMGANATKTGWFMQIFGVQDVEGEDMADEDELD